MGFLIPVDSPKDSAAEANPVLGALTGNPQLTHRVRNAPGTMRASLYHERPHSVGKLGYRAQPLQTEAWPSWTDARASLLYDRLCARTLDPGAHQRSQERCQPLFFR